MTYPERMDLTVTIDAVDVSAYVQPGSMVIGNILTQQIDTCDLVLEDAAALDIHDWQEIIILDGATKIFAGFVMNPRSAEVGVQVDIALSAVDYAVLLDKEKVKAEWTSTVTDAEILDELFTDYLPEIDATTYVSAGRSYARIRFNRKTLREALDYLANSAGADWYIDEDKNLHYFLNEENSAPFELSSSPDLSTSMPYDGLVIDTNGSGVINRVEVVGGYYVDENDETYYLAGTGEDERVILPFKLHAPTGESAIQVWRNDGSAGAPSWTALTVKSGYIDELAGADEVLYYFEEQVLELQSDWPELANAVKVTGRKEIPLRTRVRDDESYTHYGRWFDGSLIDTSITDRATARLAGRGYLAKSALAQPTISLTCYQPGLRAGQSVRIVNSLRGVDDTYLIQLVRATVGINGQTQFYIEAGTYNPDLIDLLVSLKRKTETETEWRDDEVLDEVLTQVERLALTEGTPAVSGGTGPYKWSPTASGAFDWNFGVWG